MKKLLVLLLSWSLLLGVTVPSIAQSNEAVEAVEMPQSIDLVGVNNARELGGYQAQDGRMVKQGAFLRTAELSSATQEDIQRLCEVYHLSLVLDFRTESEIESAPDPEIEGVRNVQLHILDEEALEEKRKSLTEEDLEGIDLNSSIGRLRMALKMGVIGDQMYVDFLSNKAGKEGYKQMFRELIDLPEGEAMLFHCTQGKDRTGLAAMLILAALNVDEETILSDYMLTNTYNADLIEAKLPLLEGEDIPEEEKNLLVTGLDQVIPETMINALDWMKENYGSTLGYITEELGVTDEEIEMLRDKYLD